MCTDEKCHFGLITCWDLARFIELMHDAIRAALADGADESVLAEAIQRGSGWLHIQGTFSFSCYITCS